MRSSTELTSASIGSTSASIGSTSASAGPTQASKTLFRFQRALTGLPAMAARAGHTLLSAFHLAFLATPFIIIDWDGCIASWRAVHFAGLWSMAVRRTAA